MPVCVIVGAGVSGLAAARKLVQAGGVQVIVLESAERVGGRTLSAPVPSHPNCVIDLGGQWIGSKQDAALSFIREKGITLNPQYHRGRRVMQLRGALSTYSGLIPNTSWSTLLDAQAMLLLIAITNVVLRCAPRLLLRALDGVSVSDFTQRCMWTVAGRVLVSIVVQGLFGHEPEDVSLLAFCKYVAASGSVEAMTEIGPGTLQAYTVSGGMQQLSFALADDAVRAGGRVLLNHRVSHITYDAAAGAAGTPPVRVQCANGAVFHADHIICALPPPVAHSIAFSPALPEHRSRLMREASMGGIIKSIVVYETAFWRSDGYSGEVICDTQVDGGSGSGSPLGGSGSGDGGGGGGGGPKFSFAHESGPAFNVFDNTLPFVRVNPVARAAASGGASVSGDDVKPSRETVVVSPYAGVNTAVEAASTGAAGGCRVVTTADDSYTMPSLVVFINGARAREWSSRDPGERQSAVLAQLARWFGPRALHPVAYMEKDWVADPHTRGCPIASYGRAALTAYGLHRQLREACWQVSLSGGVARSHKLHWAGTEVAEVGTGFVDGALRAGAAAAEEVLADMRSEQLAGPSAGASAVLVADSSHSGSSGGGSSGGGSGASGNAGAGARVSVAVAADASPAVTKKEQKARLLESE